MVYAQTTGTASLVGTIADATGAAIARGRITVQNARTAFVYESVSNEAGDYYIPNLSSGTYQLTVETPGFKISIQREIELRGAVSLCAGVEAGNIDPLALRPRVGSEKHQVLNISERHTENMHAESHKQILSEIRADRNEAFEYFEFLR